MRFIVLASVISVALVGSGCSCSSDDGNDGGTGGGGSSSGGGTGGANGGGSGGGVVDAGDGEYDDFPSTPIVDGAPDGSVAGFETSDGGTANGPCISEPQSGTLYPVDFPRARFSWAAMGTENAYELTVTATHQHHPLVVYTGATTWTMPSAVWSGLTTHDNNEVISYSIRALTVDPSGTVTGGPDQGSTGSFTIAPVAAGGTIVYWTTSNGTRLKGFYFGQETVQEVTRPDQSNAGINCIGCHNSTPDGLYAAFSAAPNPGSGDPASIDIRSVDGAATQPSFLTASAKTLLGRQIQHTPFFSKSHWASGDHTMFSHLQLNGKYELVWTDLEAASTDENTGWGVISRTGDPREAGCGTISHDGTKLLYMSASPVGSGMNATGGDIYQVPYNNRAGGAATPLPGASDPNVSEFYPIFSSDDQWVAFSRADNNASSYNDSVSEVWVVPAAGGTAARLNANDPSSCGGLTSPGITNSWPKWAPSTGTDGTHTYYWLTFSSTRTGGKPQLFVAPFVVDASGNATSYPAIYLWNQPADEANHTPAWDLFQLIQ